MDYEKIESEFRRLALQAGAAIMEIYGAEDFDIRSKSDESPVTAADETADALIYSGLQEAFPDMLVVTEEQAGTHEMSAETFMIVDPLDGTKEFIKRRGDFTVNIALVEQGRPTRGVVYAPARERMFYTDASGESQEEDISSGSHVPGARRALKVAQPDNGALRAVASKSHRDQATDDYISQYDVADLVSAGSSLKFCLVAAGEADFYPRLGRTMEWDTAAGHAVLIGAGGEVLDFASHGPLTYGKPGFENPFFIARAPRVNLKSAK